MNKTHVTIEEDNPVTEGRKSALTDREWIRYQRDGYLRLGPVVDESQLGVLRERMDSIMMGTAPVPYDSMLMQLDRDPTQGNKPGPQSTGHKGATLDYRKIQDLELDPLFLEYLQKPLFRDICARVYGSGTDIACNRAMFMNKPAGAGTQLGWHQDRWTDLDRDPLVTVWFALDTAAVANGCVFVVPGRHRSLINPEDGSGFLTDEQTRDLLQESEPAPLELPAGEAVLLHNHLPHSSGVNTSEIARRAFSVCYMDAATRSESGNTFRVVFGEGAITPRIETSTAGSRS